MLEKPEIADGLIQAALREAYGLEVNGLEFLPLGADVNTAVYRVDGQDGLAYFLKLRKGNFQEIHALLPRWLAEQGIQAVIAPLLAGSGRPWAQMDSLHLILSPFVQGQNGYEKEPSSAQWTAFGGALRAIHALELPPHLAPKIRREAYSPAGREQVQDLLGLAESGRFSEPVAARSAALLRAQRPAIQRLVELGQTLAEELRLRQPAQVLCHGDLHAGNLLLAADGALRIVDWDDPIYAPPERDLALLGGCPTWNQPAAIELFYQGYGPRQVDRGALAYFRIERQVQDIAAFCRELLLSDKGGADREQSYRFLAGQFEPGCEVELALNTLD
jgi:spectinomycin phosphotransferase